ALIPQEPFELLPAGGRYAPGIAREVAEAAPHGLADADHEHPDHRKGEADAHEPRSAIGRRCGWRPEVRKARWPRMRLPGELSAPQRGDSRLRAGSERVVA